MEPLIPQSKSNKCGNPTSSNCVTWQGGTIPCIPNCAGDTISDIIQKLGKTECYTQSLLDVSKLDLSCIYSPCPSCQNPTKLLDVLQIMIDAIGKCCGCVGTTKNTP